MADIPTRDAAFERYVLPEVEVMLRVAHSLTGNRADAEDLVQDSLLRAYKAIGTFDGRYPRAWLLTIVRNTHVNSHRRRRPELLRDPDTQLERHAESTTTAPDDGSGSVSPFDRDIERALAALEPRFRRVVELVDVEGLAYAEAAAVLGIPTGTVMSRLHRARRRLRVALEPPEGTR